MTQINRLEIPDDLYTQIQGMASSKSLSVHDRIVNLLERALEVEKQQKIQARLLQEIHQPQILYPS